MAVRRLLALLLAGWTAALPAYVPVRICFCFHDADKACRHGSEGHSGGHGHGHRHPGPEGGIGDTAPAPETCRCVDLKSSQDLVRVGVSEDFGARETITARPAEPADAGATAQVAPPAIPRAAGPPVYLRLLTLLV